MTRASNNIWNSQRVGKQGAFGNTDVYQLSSVISQISTFGPSKKRDIEETTGTGSIFLNDGAIRLSTGTTANSSAKVQTLEYGVYQSGRSAEAGIGVRSNNNISGTAKVDFGIFTDNNGAFFRINENGLNIVFKRGGVETVINQTDFNIDNLDGTGNSGLTWNPTKPYIYNIRFTWYGIGNFVFSLATPTNEISDQPKIYDIHKFEPDEFPSIDNPNLPIVCYVDNGDQTTDITADLTGRRYDIQGKFNPTFRHTGDIVKSKTIGTASIDPLIAFRRKPDFPGPGLENTTHCYVSSFDVISNQSLEIYIVSGGELTLSSSVVSWSPNTVYGSETAVEVNKDADAMFDGTYLYGPVLLDAANSSVSTELNTEVGLALSLKGTEPMILAARALSTSATVSAALRIIEDW